jgi:hypothetical protein
MLLSPPMVLVMLVLLLLLSWWWRWLSLPGYGGGGGGGGGVVAVIVVVVVVLTLLFVLLHAGKSAAIGAAAVAALVSHVDSTSRDVRVHVAGSLALLSIALDAKAQFAGLGDGAARSVAGLLSDDDADVVSNAVTAIRSLSELPALQSRFAGILVVDASLFVTVFHSSATAPLAELLVHGDAAIRSAGWWVLLCSAVM